MHNGIGRDGVGWVVPVKEHPEKNRLRLQALFDHALDAMLLADDEGRYVEANPAACDLLGYSRAELLQMSVWHITPAPSVRNGRALWQAFITSGQDRGEYPVQCHDGTIRTIEYRAVANILPGLHLSILRDVTEHRRAEAAVRASEERFRAFVQNASDITILLDSSGVVRYVSPSIERILGYAPASLMGTRAFERVHPEDRPRVQQLFAAVLAGDESITKLEYRHRRADGRWCYLESTGANLLDNPYVRGVVVNTRDVSERRQAEAAMRESEERWRKLVDNHPEPILVSSEGRIVFVNRAGWIMAGGRSADDLLGRCITDFVAAEHVDLMEARRLSIEEGEALPPHEYRMRRLDGSEIHAEATSVPVTYRGCPAIQTVVRDITQRKAYEQGLIAAKEEAERTVRLRSAILSNMSHEIRTPLTTVIGFAEVLGEELTGLHRELVQHIQRGAQRLSHTLNAILDLARLESGSLTLHPEPVEVTTRVREAVEPLHALLTGRGVELSVSAGDTPVWVLLDPEILTRIVTNLVSNAVKFTEQGGISVQVDASDAWIYIRVRDTGIGISPDFMPRLFDEFEQESTGLARSYEGTGLGLPITKKLVDLAGGTIDVESTKGAGSLFTVALPRQMSL